ncbi:MAG: hypothetical protein MCS20_00990 [Candidatus Phytoplasma mali]|nr:hypothetical protein [Candidatus Phytoplasma australiense]MCG7201977.1 hypothetical protein [Candidatus Phytoplasma mali]
MFKYSLIYRIYIYIYIYIYIIRRHKLERKGNKRQLKSSSERKISVAVTSAIVL